MVFALKPFPPVFTKNSYEWFDFKAEQICPARSKFCGQLVGPKIRRTDPDKMASVNELKTPSTKTQV